MQGINYYGTVRVRLCAISSICPTAKDGPKSGWVQREFNINISAIKGKNSVRNSSESVHVFSEAFKDIGNRILPVTIFLCSALFMLKSRNRASNIPMLCNLYRLQVLSYFIALQKQFQLIASSHFTQKSYKNSHSCV